MAGHQQSSQAGDPPALLIGRSSSSSTTGAFSPPLTRVTPAPGPGQKYSDDGSLGGGSSSNSAVASPSRSLRSRIGGAAFERMQAVVSIQNKVFTKQLNKMHELVNSHNAQVLQLLCSRGDVTVMPMNEQMALPFRLSSQASVLPGFLKDGSSSGQYPIAQLGAYEPVVPQTAQLAFRDNNTQTQ